LDLYAIAPTHFAADLALDVDATVRNVERLAASRIRRLLLTGSYGEFQSLHDEERLRVLGAVRSSGIAESIMACAASPSTDATATLALRMLEAGADLVMVSAPLACELSSADIVRHFEVLSQRVGQRLVVYNNPVFGVDLGPAVLGAIAAMDGYVAIKQGTRDLGNLLRGLEAVRTSGRDVRVYAASDMMAGGTLTAGVDGLTSTNCWVFPDVFPAMLAAAQSGDRRRLSALDTALGPYRSVVAQLGQPATVKAAMHLRGYDGTAAVRHPYVELDATAVRQVELSMAASDALLATAAAGAMA
jgi:dihydrodipicolinate synthase/N-acetylneuraminate lyase